jgi:hypothetical protein
LEIVITTPLTTVVVPAYAMSNVLVQVEATPETS